MNTPDDIDGLHPNEVFVFGSNLAGRHGRGAALTAYQKFGAEYGVGRGPTGDCYAIPTKDANLRRLSLGEIQREVEEFLVYAAAYPKTIFLVTKIGCGLAGYSPREIAPLFINRPPNICLPKEFHDAII